MTEVQQKKPKQFYLSGISVAQKLFFVQQLGIMVRTGISLAAALKTLSEQTTSRMFKSVLNDIQQTVEKGGLLSAGLEQHKKLFGELFINMIRAGEASGKLEEVLNQLYLQMKKDHETVSKVRGAMIYPSIVVSMMIIIGILMMVFVIPNITQVFEEINATLPLATRILISMSDAMLAYGLYIAIGAALLFGGFILFIRTKQGKHLFHGSLLVMPVMGKIIKKINLARFCRTISSLLKTDIPIVQSFDITSEVLGNVRYKEVLLEAREKIKKGITISETLSNHKNLFPPVVLQMIAIGEETGSLDTILEESAIFYEDDVSQTMENLPALIEPILLVILGVGVGAMAVAVITPLYSITQNI